MPGRDDEIGRDEESGAPRCGRLGCESLVRAEFEFGSERWTVEAVPIRPPLGEERTRHEGDGRPGDRAESLVGNVIEVEAVVDSVDDLTFDREGGRPFERDIHAADCLAIRGNRVPRDVRIRAGSAAERAPSEDDPSPLGIEAVDGDEVFDAFLDTKEDGALERIVAAVVVLGDDAEPAEPGIRALAIDRE
jgi:hypothetical protein